MWEFLETTILSWIYCAVVFGLNPQFLDPIWLRLQVWFWWLLLCFGFLLLFLHQLIHASLECIYQSMHQGWTIIIALAWSVWWWHFTFLSTLHFYYEVSEWWSIFLSLITICFNLLKTWLWTLCTGLLCKP